MGSNLANVKLMYALGPRGIVVTIPLTRTDRYDEDFIRERLKGAGIQEDEMPYVAFTPVHPALSNRLELGHVPGVELVAFSDAQPPIPIPTEPNTAPPLWSDLGPLTKVAVTKDWRAATGSSYAMQNPAGGNVITQDQPIYDPNNQDGAGIMSAQDAALCGQNANGKLKLCYGYIWKREALNFLGQGDSWSQEVTTKHGMTRTDSLSITASVGYSGGGVSASLSATYGFSITVDDESDVTNTVKADGENGYLKTAALWSLCRKYVIEVDGVVRDESNPFTVYWNDGKNHNHRQLVNIWSGVEVVSKQATLITTPFKI